MLTLYSFPCYTVTNGHFRNLNYITSFSDGELVELQLVQALYCIFKLFRVGLTFLHFGCVNVHDDELL